MLTAECYKARMATDNGLSFLEFTYMLMQSYDFLELFKKYGCRLEMGGDDQWSNMLGGADLIRRKEQRERVRPAPSSCCSPTTASKMGKTEKGALWLDPAKTSPYDFYQYWRNVDDHGRGKVPRPADLPADGRGSPPRRAQGQPDQRSQAGAGL